MLGVERRTAQVENGRIAQALRDVEFRHARHRRAAVDLAQEVHDARVLLRRIEASDPHDPHQAFEPLEEQQRLVRVPRLTHPQERGGNPELRIDPPATLGDGGDRRGGGTACLAKRGKTLRGGAQFGVEECVPRACDVEFERIGNVDLDRFAAEAPPLEQPDMSEQRVHIGCAQGGFAVFPDLLAGRALLRRHDREQAEFGPIRLGEIDPGFFLGAQRIPGFVLVFE